MHGAWQCRGGHRLSSTCEQVRVREEQGGQPRQGWRTAWMKLQLGHTLSLELAVQTEFMLK